MMNLFSNSIVFAFLIAATRSRFVFANASSSIALDNHQNKSQNQKASDAPATINISYSALETLVLAKNDKDVDSFSRLLKENHGKIGALLQRNEMASPPSRRVLKSSKSGKSAKAEDAGTTMTSKSSKASKAAAPVVKKSSKAARYNAFRKNKKSSKASAKAELLSEECLNDELSSLAVDIFIINAWYISSVDFDANGDYYAEFCELPTSPGDTDVYCDVSVPDDDTSEKEFCEDAGGHLYSTTVIVNNLPSGYTVYLENSSICVPDICDADIFIKYLDNLASIKMTTSKSGKSQKSRKW